MTLARIRFTWMRLAIRHMNAGRRLLAVEAKMRVRIRRAQHDEHHGEQAAQQMIAGGTNHGAQYAELSTSNREFRIRAPGWLK
jgi:hypothetical protein